MWATLILPLATTFKAPACLEIVARHVVTGLAAAFQTLSPRLATIAAVNAPIETPEMLVSRKSGSDPDDADPMARARCIGNAGLGQHASALADPCSPQSR